MEARVTFADRVAAAHARLSTIERAVVRFFRENREEVLVSSAAALAAKIGTSDATVIRTAQELGYSGLDDLRRQLAVELRHSLSLEARLTRTLGVVKGDAASALGIIVDVHVRALAQLCREVPPERFEAAVDLLARSRRVVLFGLGPSGALAEYFAIQLSRFGIESAALTQTGLLMADGLLRLREGDVVVALAYSRVYKEIQTLIAHAARLRIPVILMTDTLGVALGKKVNLLLAVARGNADGFSTHTATLGLIEALLVGLAAKHPAETVASLKNLNALRAELVGEMMELPVAKPRRRPRR